MHKYLSPIKRLGGFALLFLIIGLVFPSLSAGIGDERVRDGVLIRAVPFVAFFIMVLLLYILVIVLVARRFNGKLPNRAHRPIELMAIAGILCGVVFLFQPFFFVSYRYGFLLVLASVLLFILWSHVVPKNAKADASLPPFTSMQQIIAAVVALIVLFVLASSAIAANQPVEPYGVRQRLWNTYDDARKAEIADATLSQFNNVDRWFLIILNLFPAGLMFFAVRELVGIFLPAPVPTPARAVHGTG